MHRSRLSNGVNETDMSEPKILFYDIETTPLQSWVWRCGDTYIRHNMLVKGYDQYNIICIGYAWNDGEPAQIIRWDQKKKDCRKLIEEFDKLVQKADVTIGKNSARFDVKHINTQRWLHKLPPFPDWTDCSNDVEQQMRKYFTLPSMSLDYISEHLGLGGKNDMEMQDWIDIMTGNSHDSSVALDKMCNYCAKDVEDTRAVYDSIKDYIKPKFNMATYLQDDVCTNCGSSNIIKNGTRTLGKTRYQRYHCNAHGGYAGRRPVSLTTGLESKGIIGV